MHDTESAIDSLWTRTRISFRPGRTAFVTSSSNGTKPPSWPPTAWPLTKTSQTACTASKRSFTVLPAQSAGTSTSRV